MTIMFEKAGKYVEELIYKNLQGKETKVKCSFTINVENQKNTQSGMLNDNL